MAILDPIGRVVDRCIEELHECFFAERNAFGLTNRQTDSILAAANKGKAGRCEAEYIACHNYGLSANDFLDMLKLSEFQPGKNAGQSHLK